MTLKKYATAEEARAAAEREQLNYGFQVFGGTAWYVGHANELAAAGIAVAKYPPVRRRRVSRRSKP